MPVKRALFFAVIVIALLSSLPALAQDITSTPEVQPSSDQFNLSRFHGDGFSLMLPTGATVQQIDATNWIILGPSIVMGRNLFGLPMKDNAYQMTITIEDNPNGLTAYTFGAQTIANAYADYGPTRAAPVVGAQNGKLDLVGIYNDHLAGLPAAQVRLFKPDYHLLTMFVVHGGRVYEFGFREYLSDKLPFALMQQNVYELMLATLEFDTDKP